MLNFLLPMPSLLRTSFYHDTRVLTQRAPPRLVIRSPWSVSRESFHRSFSSSITMADLHVELTAPNGRKYTQPTGLFINNEWVKSSDGKKITSINPAYVPLPSSNHGSNPSRVTNPKSRPFTPPAHPMLTQQLRPPGKLSKTLPGETFLRRTAGT
jgi:hypothetical protein